MGKVTNRPAIVAAVATAVIVAVAVAALVRHRGSRHAAEAAEFRRASAEAAQQQMTPQGESLEYVNRQMKIDSLVDEMVAALAAGDEAGYKARLGEAAALAARPPAPQPEFVIVERAQKRFEERHPAQSAAKKRRDRDERIRQYEADLKRRAAEPTE